MRQIIIKRRDLTVPQIKEEEKMAKKTGNPNFRIPRTFVCRVNDAVPSSHRMCENGAVLC